MKRIFADLKEDAPRRGGSHEMIVRPTRLYKIDDNCALQSHHTLGCFCGGICQWHLRQLPSRNYHFDLSWTKNGDLKSVKLKTLQSGIQWDSFKPIQRSVKPSHNRSHTLHFSLSSGVLRISSSSSGSNVSHWLKCIYSFHASPQSSRGGRSWSDSWLWAIITCKYTFEALLGMHEKPYHKATKHTVN